MMPFSRSVLVCLSTVLLCVSAQYGDQTTYSTQGKVATVRRERNLEHWDSDTLAYYLDEYPGYDVAILFYAQWDTHSHTLAPYWDRIATMLDAGNDSSRLIMALFDCELNEAHTQLCTALNIEAYPTMMFVGSGPYHDTDPFTKAVFGKKSAGIMGESPVPNTVKFQGNWQYTDSIFDWIRTMQALSNWHTWSTEGFGKRLRNFLLPHKKPKAALPVGIPGLANGRGGTGGGSAQVNALESKIEALTVSNDQMEKIATRSATMLDSVLAPTSSQDMFTLVDEKNAWTKDTPPDAVNEILRNCVMEISLDYCQRVGTKVATDLVTDLENSGKTVEEMLAMENLDQLVSDRIGLEEPYCIILEECILSDFKDEQCRPKACPFKNESACRYLTACLDASLQQEYADALGLSQEYADALDLK